MIENIYSSDAANKSHTGKSNSKIKTPKNVRQIGKIGNNINIYVEDYVKTYTRQLAEAEYSQRCVAILIGEYRYSEGVKDVFIYGAISAIEACNGDKIQFTETVWTSTYEMIKKYFPDGEILGWYYGGTGFGLEETKRLQQVHLDNFAGGNKLLYTYDILEREDNFYLYENGAMVLQPGYYIYYERNEEMQNYMVEHKKVKQEEVMVDDRAMKEIRTKLQEKQQPPVTENEQKTVLRLTYAAGTLIMVVALVVIVTIMNNSEKMNSLEEALNTISNRLATQDNGDEKKEDANVVENIFNTDDESNIPASNPNAIQENMNTGNSVQASVTPTTNDVDTKTDSGESALSSDNNESNLNSGENQQITSAPADNTSNSEGSNSQESIKETTPNTENQTEVKTNTDGTEKTDTSSNETKETSTIDSSKLKKYTVKSGDTISSICMKLYGNYGNMQTIKELNQLVDENKIIEGQVLLIP